MSCLFPKLMKVYPPGSIERKDGSPGSLVEFVSYEKQKDFMLENGDLDSIQISEWSTQNLINSDGECCTLYRVPCGQCSECRRQRARLWANRLVCEQSLYRDDNSWFVTLTYDDNNIPLGIVVNDCQFPTLFKRDVQLFLKRLRRRLGTDTIRFYCAGEYGSVTARPHYHLIIYGIDLWKYGMHPRGYNELGQMHFESLLIDELWPHGMNTVAPSNWQTCYYTASYVTKKLNGKAEQIYSHLGIAPEFSTMSRRPGIAWAWYQSNYDELSKRYRAPVLGRLYDLDRYGLNVLFKDDPLMVDTVKRFKVDNAEKLVDALRSDSDIALWKQNLDKSEMTSQKRKFLSSI